MSHVQPAIRAYPRQCPVPATGGAPKPFHLSLLLLILATFHGYIALVSFCPELIARRLAQGSNMTFGVAAGVFLFVFFCALSALYVYRANGEFDRLTQALVAGLEEEQGA